MIEVIHMEAKVDNVQDIERLLKRAGAYIAQGYRLLSFGGSDEKVELELTTKEEIKEERRIGFT